MQKIFNVLVENRSGVLSKVAGLFARRCFNIDSLAVGETNDPTASSMTIVSSGSEALMEQVEKQLNKKVDVIKVNCYTKDEAVCRELMMIKVKYTAKNRIEILSICTITGAQIVDTSRNLMTLQICDTPDKVQILLDLLRGIGIVEIARTGTIALSKCTEE